MSFNYADNMEYCDKTQNMYWNSKQALGHYISICHLMNANLNQIHCKYSHELPNNHVQS